MNMQMSPKGIEILRKLEGVATRAYKDAVGYLTIGVGHMLTRDELHSGKIHADGRIIRWGYGISDEEVDAILRADLRVTESIIGSAVKVPLKQHEADALISFTFNVGVGAFLDSTLLRCLNDGRYQDVPAQLRRWVRAGGSVLKGLERRREAEVSMWEGINYPA